MVDVGNLAAAAAAAKDVAKPRAESNEMRLHCVLLYK